MFDAAAAEFSARGFDGVSVDDIARRARANKAMIYYHFADKLALYRAIYVDMLSTMGGTVAAIAAADEPPIEKLNRFIAAFVRLADGRPWFPTLMLREMAEGAPRLDLETLGHVRTVFAGFGTILSEGEAAGVFRKVHPVLAYTSIVGPLIMNAARERVAARPGRGHFPMLLPISHDDLIAHGQYTAQRMLAAD